MSNTPSCCSVKRLGSRCGCPSHDPFLSVVLLLMSPFCIPTGIFANETISSDEKVNKQNGDSDV